MLQFDPAKRAGFMRYILVLLAISVNAGAALPPSHGTSADHEKTRLAAGLSGDG